MPRVRRSVPSTEKVIFLSDLHFPHHDPAAISLVLSFIRWFEPEYVYIIGDLLDFYALSSFSKDPNRTLELQKELDMAREFLTVLRRACPDAEIFFREGNHEDRLQRYLKAHPEIFNLRALTMDSLLNLTELNIHHYGYREDLFHKGFCVEHGDVVRKKSAYTAAAMLEKRVKSGITGHTHRLGVHYRSLRDQTLVWYENGCLCQTKPDYIIGAPDWQQGFTIGHWIESSQRFVLDQICITNQKIFYQGVLFKL
tara:strand:+ start:1109 stop:1870 length:762 start_codon:yes stop_codon:yes gene_type:complete